jgi:hypothetical protein
VLSLCRWSATKSFRNPTTFTFHSDRICRIASLKGKKLIFSKTLTSFLRETRSCDSCEFYCLILLAPPFFWLIEVSSLENLPEIHFSWNPTENTGHRENYFIPRLKFRYPLNAKWNFFVNLMRSWSIDQRLQSMMILIVVKLYQKGCLSKCEMANGVGSGPTVSQLRQCE